MDLASLTNVVRHLAVQQRALQASLNQVKSKQDEMRSSDSSSKTAALETSGKLEAESDIVRQEIHFVKQQQIKHRTEFQGHLTHMDDQVRYLFHRLRPCCLRCRADCCSTAALTLLACSLLEQRRK